MGSGDRNESFNDRPDVRIADVASRQHGLITAAQSTALGLSRWASRRRASASRWESVLPGVYRIAGAPVTGRQAALAAVLWAGDGAVVSHRSAAVLWGLDGVETSRVEIAVPYGRAPRHPYVTVHRSKALHGVDRDLIDNIPVTSVARTVIDIAGVLEGEALERAMEDAFHRGLCKPTFLRWRLNELGGAGRPGAARLRRLLDERGRDGALESVLEVKVWRLITGSDLPRPVRQHPVRAEGQLYRLDFAWPVGRVAVECDGFESHGRRTAFERDRSRSAALAAAGWRLVPVTWRDVTADPSRVVARLRAALDNRFIEPSVASSAPRASMKRADGRGGSGGGQGQGDDGSEAAASCFP